MVTKLKMANGWLELSAVPQNAFFLFLYSIAFVILFLSIPPAKAQSAEEEAVKIVIRAETNAWMRRDADAWKAMWVHSPKASRTIVSNNVLTDVLGWENFGPSVIKDLKDDVKPEGGDFRHHNYSVHISDKMAWVNFDQQINPPNANAGSPKISREQRVLVVHDGRWKILSQMTYLPESFESSPETIQSSLQNISYRLFEDKEFDEAIEVLELSAKLYPESEDTYSSLGSAYAEAGKRRKAIKNYKKCLTLNSENRDAKEGLAELMQ